ncbi:MAG: thiamine biosynthesis protein ThiF [Actinomycetota bacterium]
MRPALKNGLLPVWRDRDTLQIGIDPRRAVALTGMNGAAWVVGLLDGSRERAQVIAAAAGRGIPAQVAERVLTLLAAGGALEDFPAGTYRALPPESRAQLAPELAAASLAYGDGDGGARVLARRQGAHVWISGSGPIASGISSLLAAAGVGEITRADPHARNAGGSGRSGRAGRAGPAAGRAAPAAGRGPTARGRDAAGPPNLAVLIGTPDPDMATWLVRERLPHLAAAGSEAIGVVGPLVQPGQSACLRCMDLTRAERDPAWPLILAQLAGRQPETPACDAVLAAAVAAQAAAQALAFVDRPAQARPVTNGTLELVLPAWQWRRRTWPPHRDCVCRRRGAHSGE